MTETLQRLYGSPSTGPEVVKEALREELTRQYDRLAYERTRCWQNVQELERQKRDLLEELEAVADGSLDDFL